MALLLYSYGFRHADYSAGRNLHMRGCAWNYCAPLVTSGRDR